MKLDFSLQLKQEQKLLMTPEMQMAVKILQLNTTELIEFIDEQILENPLLEVAEVEPVSKEFLEDSFEDRIIKAVKENYLDHENYSNTEFNYTDPDQDQANEYLNFAVKEKDLWEELREQLSFIPMSKRDRILGAYIIDNIDRNGYLSLSDSELAIRTKSSLADVENMIKIIQSFEPFGICARNIEECLIIQLKVKGINNSVLESIIQNSLEVIADANIGLLVKTYNISAEEASDYLSIIRSLDPKPGVRLSSDDTKYVIPDGTILKKYDKFIVVMNEEVLPELKVSRMYKRLLEDKTTSEYAYVKSRMQSAFWLIKSIYQRMETIKKVFDAILEYQYDYFDKDETLKPMSLKNISDATGFHESTISRSIKGKYLQTPKGLFEVKNFFIKGFQSKSGDAVNVDKVKSDIKKIIDEEKKVKPLSDNDISEILKQRGIDISRRTVAKYREELLIPASSKRKIKN